MTMTMTADRAESSFALNPMDDLNDLRMSAKALPLLNKVKAFIKDVVEPMSEEFHRLGEGNPDICTKTFNAWEVRSPSLTIPLGEAESERDALYGKAAVSEDASCVEVITKPRLLIAEDDPVLRDLYLRKFGGVPHSGFGMGIERAVAWICGLEHVRETIPFPRMLHRLYP